MKTLTNLIKHFAPMKLARVYLMGVNINYSSYTVCILLALFPPIWFEVIHDHLKNW